MQIIAFIYHHLIRRGHFLASTRILGRVPRSDGLLSDLGTFTNGDEIVLSRPTLVLAVRLILIGSVLTYTIGINWTNIPKPKNSYSK
jgi:hypothetical protein